MRWRSPARRSGDGWQCTAARSPGRCSGAPGSPGARWPAGCGSRWSALTARRPQPRARRGARRAGLARLLAAQPCVPCCGCGPNEAAPDRGRDDAKAGEPATKHQARCRGPDPTHRASPLLRRRHLRLRALRRSRSTRSASSESSPNAVCEIFRPLSRKVEERTRCAAADDERGWRDQRDAGGAVRAAAAAEGPAPPMPAPSLVAQCMGFARYAQALRHYLAAPLPAGAHRAQLSADLAARAGNFLRLVEHGVYARPRAPIGACSSTPGSGWAISRRWSAGAASRRRSARCSTPASVCTSTSSRAAARSAAAACASRRLARLRQSARPRHLAASTGGSRGAGTPI